MNAIKSVELAYTKALDAITNLWDSGLFADSFMDDLCEKAQAKFNHDYRIASNGGQL